MCSEDFGVPQRRERVYIVGCRKDVAKRDFVWPRPRVCRTLESFLDKNGDSGRPLSNTNLANIKWANQRLKSKGLSPELVDAVVDIGGGRAKGHLMIGSCPTITATRAQSEDYWLTSARRRLSQKELFRLQGFKDEEVDFSGLSMQQVGKLVGNAMTVTVLAALIQEGLSACELAKFK